MGVETDLGQTRDRTQWKQNQEARTKETVDTTRNTTN